MTDALAGKTSEFSDLVTPLNPQDFSVLQSLKMKSCTLLLSIESLINGSSFSSPHHRHVLGNRHQYRPSPLHHRRNPLPRGP